MDKTAKTAVFTSLGLLCGAALLPDTGPTHAPAAVEARPDLPPPVQPETQPDLPDPISGLIPYPIGRVGLAREGEDETRWLRLERPVGAADTCTRTTQDAQAGEQWTSAAGPNYVALSDGTWYRYRDTPPLIAQTTPTPTEVAASPFCVGGVCSLRQAVQPAYTASAVEYVASVPMAYQSYQYAAASPACGQYVMAGTQQYAGACGQFQRFGQRRFRETFFSRRRARLNAGQGFFARWLGRRQARLARY